MPLLEKVNFEWINTICIDLNPNFSLRPPDRLPTMSRPCPDTHPTIPRLFAKFQETMVLFS
jgi:hypothetical protein